MSSNVQDVDVRASDDQIPQVLLDQANYLTSKMQPLAGGGLHFRSKSVLHRVIDGTMPELAK